MVAYSFYFIIIRLHATTTPLPFAYLKARLLFISIILTNIA
jgi:hypothetical protein